MFCLLSVSYSGLSSDTLSSPVPLYTSWRCRYLICLGFLCPNLNTLLWRSNRCAALYLSADETRWELTYPFRATFAWCGSPSWVAASTNLILTAWMPPISLQLNLLLSAPSLLTHEGSLAPESSLCLLISTTNHSLMPTKAQPSSQYKGDIHYSNAFRETIEGRFISPSGGKRKSILVTAEWGNRCDSHISADNTEHGWGKRKVLLLWTKTQLLNTWYFKLHQAAKWVHIKRFTAF